MLCHAPNSAPPERALSILNNAIGDQQVRARADFKKAIIQLQFDSRGREYYAHQKKKWKGGGPGGDVCVYFELWTHVACHQPICSILYILSAISVVVVPWL